MRLCVATEQRFTCTPDRHVWAPAGPAYAFWRRYLEVFDEVVVIARTAEIPTAEPAWNQADGPGVTFVRVPYFVGAAAYLKKCLQVRSAVRNAVPNMDAVLMRGASVLTVSLASSLTDGHPFGVEVIGDPYDVFAPGSIEHPLRPALRWWLTRNLRRQCKKACAVAYVTQHTLQARYPSAREAFGTSYSSIELPDHAFIKAPRCFALNSHHPVRIITVGSLEQMYKGIDVLIDALAVCQSWDRKVELTIIGEGRCRPKLETQARNRKLEHAVTFMGQLRTKTKIAELLDNSDLFVLASKTEGLPRAMVEAMARGLPCIGTAVGGIPELLSKEDLVASGDAIALARKIVQVVREPGRMDRMAVNNLNTAHKYTDSVLAPRRREFLKHLCQVTRSWKSSLVVSGRAPMTNVLSN